MKKIVFSIAVAFATICGLNASAQSNDSCATKKCCNKTETCVCNDSCRSEGKCECSDKCKMGDCVASTGCMKKSKCNDRPACHKKQGKHHGCKGNRVHPERCNPMKDLNLTAEQEKKMNDLRETYREKSRKYVEKQRAEREKRAAEYDKQIKKILTPEQYAKYKEMRKVRKFGHKNCFEFNGDCNMRRDCDNKAINCGEMRNKR